MMDSKLLEIQSLQFRDTGGANALLLAYLHRAGLNSVERIELVPRPESLNSFNGRAYFADGTSRFFKAHAENDQENRKYHQVELLRRIGYPLISIEETLFTPDREIAFYPLVTLPTLFEVTANLEDEPLADSRCAMLLQHQQNFDQLYRKLLLDSLTPPIPTPEAPVHLLFHHRLGGRLNSFYARQRFVIASEQLSYDELCALQWTINGVRYDSTIASLLREARIALDPLRPLHCSIGHGDAHNGNVFYDESSGELLLFDPAFAGIHNPLLELAKPLFHNSFAKWMYFPEDVHNDLTIECTLRNGIAYVDHSFVPSPLRTAMLRSKLDEVVRPVRRELIRRGLPENDCRALLRSALFCCPLLTVNLAAPFGLDGSLASRYSTEIKMLAFAMCVEAAANPIGRGRSVLQSLFVEIHE